MNDLSGFEVLENVQSPFEDDPFMEEEPAVAEVETQKPPALEELPPPAAAPAHQPSAPTAQDPSAEEAHARAEHEAAEAKRKAEWEAKQTEKRAARQAALDKIGAMSAEQLIQAATQKAGKDTEKLTRRNMKECVCEYIQTLCLEDPEFARLTLLPPKSMVNCFAYINHKAWEYVQDELKANGQQPGRGSQAYGCDVPDGLCYGWAEEYFRASNVKEDDEQEEKFVPRPYRGPAAAKLKGKTAARKKAEPKPAPKPAEEKPADTGGQLTLGDFAA